MWNVEMAAFFFLWLSLCIVGCVHSEAACRLLNYVRRSCIVRVCPGCWPKFIRLFNNGLKHYILR